MKAQIEFLSMLILHIFTCSKVIDFVQLISYPLCVYIYHVFG
jgi:hypothetical protein